MSKIKACKVSDVSAGRPLWLRMAGESFVVVKSADGHIFAFENKCSHADKALHAGKWDSERCEITCPVHGAVFSVKTGEALVGPAVLPIQLFDVSINIENGEPTVFVTIPDDE